MRRAAVNASLDLIRSRRDDRTLELVDVPSGTRNPDAGELKAALRRALGRLGPQSAEIFALRFFEGLSNQEIGRMLGMSRVLVGCHHPSRGPESHGDRMAGPCRKAESPAYVQRLCFIRGAMKCWPSSEQTGTSL